MRRTPRYEIRLEASFADNLMNNVAHCGGHHNPHEPRGVRNILLWYRVSGYEFSSEKWYSRSHYDRVAYTHPPTNIAAWHSIRRGCSVFLNILKLVKIVKKTVGEKIFLCNRPFSSIIVKTNPFQARNFTIVCYLTDFSKIIRMTFVT